LATLGVMETDSNALRSRVRRVVLATLGHVEDFFQTDTRKLWTLALETEDLQTENACAFQGEAAFIPALASQNSL